MPAVPPKNKSPKKMPSGIRQSTNLKNSEGRLQGVE